MDISKLDGKEKVKLCRKYFFIGLALLPLVWLTNFVWFFSEAFCKPPSEHRTSIRKYVIFSGVGFLIWTMVIVSWEVVFQVYRSEGHAWSDYLSFVFPTGRV